ncbi:gamma-glutamylcyclotransferase family protein [Azotobacter vinelandii]|uniref:gamma-glutamylcyclotransferase family protein n=1 Tax=Azotobacter vinelandii TaxID=354 RepID=UPI002665E740|nr:gamma-glutamylcyclotransferase family protein [Azotobacter vinelandii]WKN21780.1 gamma-glutamylcyclotransferase [Azotobacter vinelandii]
MSVSQDNHLLYFAYGVDMNPEHIAARCDEPQVFMMAHLPDHALAFFGYADRWDGGLESIVESPGDRLYGVIYEVTYNDADYLDACQGARLDGTGPYFQFPVEVIGEDGRSHSVFTYKKSSLGETTQPSSGYLDYIVAGATAQGLPEAYIERLKRIDNKPTDEPLPRKTDLNRILVGGHACNCG